MKSPHLQSMELLALGVTLLLVAVQYFLPDFIVTASPFIVILGMIFPGIPHGAIDHHIDLKNKNKPRFLVFFMIRYLSIMALVLLIWYLLPLLGLVLFLMYSIWHFGETDARRWSSFSVSTSLIGGFSVLMLILALHPEEFKQYLFYFGLNSDLLPNQFYGVGVFIGLMGMLYISFKVPEQERLKIWLLISVLLLGALLPLLLAFGIYFILVHSFSGWLDIKNRLKVNHITLIKFATPFSLGAFLFIAGFLYFIDQNNSDVQFYVSLFFIALASISASHVLMMSKFYHQTELSQVRIEDVK